MRHGIGGVTMNPAINLLRYPDGERRELRRWAWMALGAGALLGSLGMQLLTWQVQARLELDALEHQREQARRVAIAEQARLAKIQQELHERRLRWQEQVSHMLGQQAQAVPVWQLLAQSGVQQGVSFGRLQWSGDRWTLQGQAPDMSAVVRMRDELLVRQGLRSELKTWATVVNAGSGAFQLEWTWPSAGAKP